MKKVVALALALVMALSIATVVFAEPLDGGIIYVGEQKTQLVFEDTRAVTWTWTVPTELRLEFDESTVLEGYQPQSWKEKVEITDALIEVGKEIDISVAVTTPLTNGNGKTLTTKVNFNHSAPNSPANLRKGVFFYDGKIAENTDKALVTFYAQGDLDQVFKSNYVGEATFTCTYVDAPAGEPQ